MALVENFAAYTDPLGFGITAIVNGAKSVNGIMDLAYAEPLGNMVEGSAPVFSCAEGDLGPIAHGDTLVAAGRSFKVCGVEPDGQGWIVLKLERQ